MTWGVYQDYVTNRTQGTFHGGAKKYMGIQNKLYNQLYRSFGLANKVRIDNLWSQTIDKVTVLVKTFIVSIQLPLFVNFFL